MDAAVADFLDAMRRLNKEMNGEVPSEVVRDGANDPVPRSVAYAISEVARQLGDTALELEAREVLIAWNAVLAGDIDDLDEHLEHERRTAR